MRYFFKAALLAAFSALCSCNPGSDRTAENLKTAIESGKEAMTMYEIYSQKAAQEAMFNASSLFQAVSNSQMIHIRNYQSDLATLGITDFVPADFGVESGSLFENLRRSADEERYKYEEMYPVFLETAQDEKQEDAARSFEYAFRTARKHYRLFSEAMELIHIKDDDSLVSSAWYVCIVCGDVYGARVKTRNCEICGAPAEGFIMFGYAP